MTSRLSFAISTVENAERGEPDDGPAVAADQQIEEEIAEIKRYEVRVFVAASFSPLPLSIFVACPLCTSEEALADGGAPGFHNHRYVFETKTGRSPLVPRNDAHATTDWVQDATRERLRRKARRKQTKSLFDTGQNDWRYKLYSAYEAGQGWIVVTIIGAAIGINAALLNIITEWLSDIKMGYCTTAFYLNEKFCCWGEDNG